jgi:hypothetical protein
MIIMVLGGKTNVQKMGFRAHNPLPRGIVFFLHLTAPSSSGRNKDLLLRDRSQESHKRDFLI